MGVSEVSALREFGNKKSQRELAFCGTTGIRTWDTRIFSPLLYQLSYSTIKGRQR